MAWMAYAALRKGDIARLADTVGLLADYCAGSFESVFPLREGAKLAALRWLSEPRFTSQCPRVDASEGDLPHIRKMGDSLLKMKGALEKRFASVGAPFPALLYKRVMEWDKAVSALAQNSGVSVFDNVDSQNRELSNRPVNAPAAEGQTRNGGGNGETPITVDEKDNRQAAVVIKLTRGEYQEIVQGIDRMKSLLQKFR
jgi:hypothetical protein